MNRPLTCYLAIGDVEGATRTTSIAALPRAGGRETRICASPFADGLDRTRAPRSGALVLARRARTPSSSPCAKRPRTPSATAQALGFAIDDRRAGFFAIAPRASRSILSIAAQRLRPAARRSSQVGRASLIRRMSKPTSSPALAARTRWMRCARDRSLCRSVAAVPANSPALQRRATA